MNDDSEVTSDYLNLLELKVSLGCKSIYSIHDSRFVFGLRSFGAFLSFTLVGCRVMTAIVTCFNLLKLTHQSASFTRLQLPNLDLLRVKQSDKLSYIKRI